MAAFYNTEDIKKIISKYLVIDTNILALLSSDLDFLKSFSDVFRGSTRVLDPIVKLEFLKGTQIDSLYKKKKEFLEFHELNDLTDHVDIYNKMKIDTENISRIYAHHGATEVPLGDILITSRLKYHHSKHLFLTLDQQDFTALLFDRLAVVSIESKETKNKMLHSVLNHIVILEFNMNKYKACLEKLKN